MLGSDDYYIWILPCKYKNQTDNNSLYQQQQEILNKYNDAKIIKETYTGTTTNRPKFEKIISSLKRETCLLQLSWID